MDGVSHHRKIFLIMLPFFLLVCLWGLYEGVRAQGLESENRIAWLVLHYPQLESTAVGLEEGKLGSAEDAGIEAIRRQLRDKYMYDALDFAGGRRMLAVGIFLILTGGVVFIALFAAVLLVERRTGERRAKELENGLLRLRGEGPDRLSAPEAVGGAYGQLWERVRELERYIGDFQERMETEEQETKSLVTNISHQLKTPLASLKMSYEMAGYEELEEAEQKAFLGQVGKEIDKLEELLNELVNLSRLENHMIRLSPEPLPLGEAAAGAAEMVMAKACAARIELSLCLEENVECVYDRRWTTEAVVNLLDNAVKYSPPGTKVEVRTASTPNYGLIEVEDRGMGIGKEEFHKVFQRFYRGKRAVETGNEGAGVGLYLTRSIVEQQGGLVRIKPKMGEGSVFQVLLPRERQRAARESRPDQKIRREERPLPFC